MKLGRTRFDYGIVTVGSLLEVGETGICKHASVVVGNYDEKPFRATEVEKVLIGHEVTATTINAVVEILNGTSPTSSVHASSDYKKQLAMTLTAESILTSYRRALHPQ